MAAVRRCVAAGALAAALNAAFRGWHVLPLRPGEKRPLAHDADHCRRTGPCAAGHQGWEAHATRDLADVEAHWGAHPDHGVGIATGPSGLVVVDLDVPKPGDPSPAREWAAAGVRNGRDVLRVLADRAGAEVTPTYLVRTGRGGWHLYYTAPAGVRLGNTSRAAGPWIDTRGWGGQVVAAGTAVAGRPYTLVRDLPVAPLPGWLTPLFQPINPARHTPQPAHRIRVGTDRRAAYLHAAVTRELDLVANAAPGTHNATLYSAALVLGQLAAGGAFSSSYAADLLEQAAGGHITGSCDCRPSGIRATITSGLRAGAKRPRTVLDRPAA
jgi:hypothetical protein